MFLFKGSRAINLDLVESIKENYQSDSNEFERFTDCTIFYIHGGDVVKIKGHHLNDIQKALWMNNRTCDLKEK